MHPIGARVLYDGVTIVGFVAGNTVLNQLSRRFVCTLSQIGSVVFPDVLAVIQDTEQDVGVQLPPKTMAGNRHENCVGTTIVMANASLFDVHGALQGFSVWTEDIPGMADNWYFVMPNLCGETKDGVQCVAVRLRHGVAISWDGRLIRQCTSLSRPDGVEGNFVGCWEQTQNHLYRTLTAEKERLVNVGRKRAKLLEEMHYYAYNADERAVIVGNVDDVPDSPAMSVAEVNEDPNELEVNDESDAKHDDAVLPRDGVTTKKRQKVETS